MDINYDSLLDVIGELFSDEISIGVTDSSNYIYFRPSKRIDLRIKVGDPIKEGTIAHQALVKKQKVSEFIDRELFGVPYYGMAVPYYEKNALKGTVLAIYPVVTEGKSVVTVKTADGWKPVPFDEVIYIEVKNRKTFVYTMDGYGIHKNTLQDFEYSLPRELFVRCHRSFIVNVHHIDEIFPDTHSTFVLEMKNGMQIPVSQNYASYFRKLLGF